MTARLLATALLAAVAALPGPALGQAPGEAQASTDPATRDREVLCRDPEARAFDFWIGSWNVLNRNRPPDGVRFHETGRATDRVYPVVGGCGIVEHWRGRAIGRYILGFSVRAWDPEAGEWRLALLWPTTGEPSFGELRGGFRHGRGEFSFRRATAAGDTILNRFTFSDISTDALRWENATSRDGGRSWEGSWIMEFERRDRVAETGLLNGPAVTTGRCPGPEHRRFDPYLGAWAGIRTTAGGDSLDVTAHLVPILGGCAVMERVWDADGLWEAFRVRAWEPGAGRWVEYALDSDRRVLVRREATAGDDPPAFRDASPGPDGTLTRTRWTEGPDGTPGWITEEADAEAGPWRPVSAVRLGEPLERPFRP